MLLVSVGRHKLCYRVTLSWRE